MPLSSAGGTPTWDAYAALLVFTVKDKYRTGNHQEKKLVLII